MKRIQPGKRLLCLAAALFLLVSLAPAPGLAAKEAQEIEIVWLNGATSECENIIYNQELGWVCFITYSESGYAVYDVSTGTRI